MNQIISNGKKYLPTKVVCIGKNFADHVKEMGGKDIPKEPVIFIKPNSAVVSEPKEVHVPESFGLLHYEVELCFVVGKKAKDISEKDADNVIAGFAVGIDLTLRDMQSIAKKAGNPWALAKGFDSSAVFGKFKECHPEPQAKDPGPHGILRLTPQDDRAIKLFLNDELRQSGNTHDMIFKPAQILSYVSRYMTIEEGDVFMCGTPRGVGEVKNGDIIRAEISGLPVLEFKILR